MSEEKLKEGTVEEQPKKDSKKPKKQTPKKLLTRRIWNISGSKIELEIGGEVVSILPKETIEIPADFSVPLNIGLVER